MLAERCVHGLIIQVTDKGDGISTSLRQGWHISHNRETKILLIVDNFLLYQVWQCWGATGERAWYRVPTSCLFGFSTFTPRSNFTVQNPGCMMARCSPSNQWTRVDPGPLTEPTAHQYQLNTLTPACAWLIWLLLSLTRVPVEPRRVGSRARF